MTDEAKKRMRDNIRAQMADGQFEHTVMSRSRMIEFFTMAMIQGKGGEFHERDIFRAGAALADLILDDAATRAYARRLELVKWIATRGGDRKPEIATAPTRVDLEMAIASQPGAIGSDPWVIVHVDEATQRQRVFAGIEMNPEETPRTPSVVYVEKPS